MYGTGHKLRGGEGGGGGRKWENRRSETVAPSCFVPPLLVINDQSPRTIDNT